MRYESISVPEGRTYSPPTKWAVYPFRWSGRALCEAVAAPAGALWTMPQSCELAVIVHAVSASTTADAFVSRGTKLYPALR